MLRGASAAWSAVAAAEAGAVPRARLSRPRGCSGAQGRRGGVSPPDPRPLGWESARDGSRACKHSSLWKRRGVALAVAVGFGQSHSWSRDLSEGGSAAAAHRLPTRPPSTGAGAERVQSVRRTEATGQRCRAALVQVSTLCVGFCVGGIHRRERRPPTLWSRRGDSARMPIPLVRRARKC